jgi:predicted small metal-binding protein
VEVQKIVTCDCGFEAIGTEDDLVEIIQAHERDTHGVEVTREEVLALAAPIDSTEGQG